MASIGLSLIFGVTGLVNFAHGELVSFGGLAARWLPTWGSGPGLSLIASGVLAVADGGLLGYALERGLFRPLRRRRTGNVSLIVVTIGLSLTLSNLYLIMAGGNALQYSQYVIQTQVGPGPFTLTPKDWTIVVLSSLILVTTGVVLRRTRYGTALRAVADNPDLAASSGIGVERVILITWVAERAWPPPAACSSAWPPRSAGTWAGDAAVAVRRGRAGRHRHRLRAGAGRVADRRRGPRCRPTGSTPRRRTLWRSWC